MTELGPAAWPPSRPIRTERLVLREAEARDHAVSIDLLASPEVHTYLDGPRARDELDELPETPGKDLGICVGQLDGTMIGQVILRRSVGEPAGKGDREGRARLSVPAGDVGIRLRRRGVQSGTRLAGQHTSRRTGGALYPDRQRALDAPRREAGIHPSRAVCPPRRRVVVRHAPPVTPPS